MAIEANSLIGFSRLHRLQWEETQKRFVILYPEGMVELNTPAAEILKLCDGTRHLEDIVLELEAKFDTRGLKNDIEELLEAALKNGWIELLADG